MKLYTNQKSQFGQTRLILNEKITFDKLGCAEVEGEVVDRVIKYSDWFSKTPFSFKKDVELDTQKVEEKEEESSKILVLKEEIERLKSVSEARTSEIKLKNNEISELKNTLQKEVDLKSELEIEKEKQLVDIEKEKEVLETKMSLYKEGTDVEGLKEVCASLEIPEGDYIKRKSKDVLIDLIANYTVKE